MILRQHDLVDAIYLCVLARRPESVEVASRYIGSPILNSVAVMLASEEFEVGYVGRVFDHTYLPHEQVDPIDLLLAMERLRGSGTLSLRGGRTVLLPDAATWEAFTSRQLVDAMYWDVLLRWPEPEASDAYAARLDGGVSVAVIYGEIIHSEEAAALWPDVEVVVAGSSDRARESFVRAAYKLILNRPADAEGLRHFMRKMQRGARAADVAGELSCSPEASAPTIDASRLAIRHYMRTTLMEEPFFTLLTRALGSETSSFLSFLSMSARDAQGSDIRHLGPRALQLHDQLLRVLDVRPAA